MAEGDRLHGTPFLVEDLRTVPGREVGHVSFASLSLSEAVSRARAGLTADRSDVDSDELQLHLVEVAEHDRRVNERFLLALDAGMRGREIVEPVAPCLQTFASLHLDAAGATLEDVVDVIGQRVEFVARGLARGSQREHARYGMVMVA